MRCERCGKQISNGNLCNECLNIVKEDYEASRDSKILMKLTRSYSFKYQLLIHWEWILFCFILIAASFRYQNVLVILCCFLFTIFSNICILIYNRKIAENTKCIFYETKVVYTFDFLFIHKKKVLKYSEIKDIVYNNRGIQKRFGIGNLGILSKKSGIIFNGILIENISDIEVVFKKLTQLVGKKIA